MGEKNQAYCIILIGQMTQSNISDGLLKHEKMYYLFSNVTHYLVIRRHCCISPLSVCLDDILTGYKNTFLELTLRQEHEVIYAAQIS